MTIDYFLTFRSDRKSKNCATFYFKHLDTDSEADCGQLVQESSNTVDDSSEEEWTYTPAHRNGSLVVSEQRRTNVVIRLDFGESQVDLSEKMHFAQKKSLDKKEMERDDREAQQKDSDDEKKNDKSSIEKLIKEVENLKDHARHRALGRPLGAREGMVEVERIEKLRGQIAGKLDQ